MYYHITEAMRKQNEYYKRPKDLVCIIEVMKDGTIQDYIGITTALHKVIGRENIHHYFRVYQKPFVQLPKLYTCINTLENNVR